LRLQPEGGLFEPQLERDPKVLAAAGARSPSSPAAGTHPPAEEDLEDVAEVAEREHVGARGAPHPRARPAEQVVLAAAHGIRERVVCRGDLLEALLCLRVAV